jgi:hypothetical protein
MSDADGEGAAPGLDVDGVAAEVALGRILERVESIGRSVERLERLADRAPALAGVAIDAFDEACRGGPDVDGRLGRLIRLAGRVSDAGTLDALERLVDHAPRLAEALDRAPGVFGMLLDLFDEWAGGLRERGIDPATAVRRGLHAALWLGQRVEEADLRRLDALLGSDLLDPRALAALDKAGRALASGHGAALGLEGGRPPGALGLLGALRDPDVRRSLAFAADVARRLGRLLPESDDPPDLA